jgi:anti-sigma B factor antagonist
MFDEGRPFEIRQERGGSELMTLRLLGEFDLAGCEQFEDTLARITGNVSQLVIDLEGLSFIDSSAIRCLVSAKARASESGLRLSVALPTDGQVRKVFELTGTDRVLVPERG